VSLLISCVTTPPPPSETIRLTPSEKTEKVQLPPTKLSPPSAKDTVSTKEPPVGFVRYTVKAGDSLITLANRFGMSLESLKSVNGLSETALKEGTVIFVPKIDVPESVEGEPFSYPVIGRLVANFETIVDNAPSRGIEIAVPFGTPVKASRTGVVSYVSECFPGYGGLVLIRHGNYCTLYGFLSEIYVACGSRVRKGEVIGKSGKSPYSGKERLRFRIYDGDTAVNPALFIK
jgi:murein DD-endopeptidase MepM/ murein hydrolase activator NlpD